MYPYYRQDTEAGLLDPLFSRELLQCLWIKLNEINKIRDRVASLAIGGYPMFQNLIVGGQTPEGGDATNALSYLCLEVTESLALPQPSLSVRLHPGTAGDFLEAACRLVRAGTGMPAFFNDGAIVPLLEDMGYEPEEARNYAEVGCVEPQAPGNTQGYYTGGYVNLAKCLEPALNDGLDPVSGKVLGARTGAPRQFRSYADVETAFEKQVRFFVDLLATGDNIIDSIQGRVAPSPFLSALVDDCLATGTSEPGSQIRQ